MRSRSPGEAQRAVLAAVGVGERDVNQADRLLRRAAGGTGDSGDADPERGADATADSLRESLRDFGADRAFRFNQLGGHVRPRRLQIVAVADHAAAENTKSFRERASAARPAIRRCNFPR